jgi:hypothetical protein
LEQAHVWCNKAADGGDPNAQYVLGHNLMKGTTLLAKDEVLGVAWLRKAADQQHGPAQHALGTLLIKGGSVLPKDTPAGARLLASSAKQGVKPALDALSSNAGDREVAHECCGGCGERAEKMKLCTACRVARFCSTECAKRMWPTHKPHCIRWKAE